ncbi:MAG: hypothetical protein A2V21_305360 [Deltaproteobacteria bacterium GWC2_55_46]|nr:MAG: hypothetical protein A2Z79_09225 [Deltaproteobacteria bacterium GWA2_55_82]OGQ64642.1 MAG: hypothetical protein A3I81_11495 [Deltaproteobacteria bacterium RIFCSPLOWO2_02_FULL_55_12]OIJ73742.1 MAG: hypothetical protein A2V21_305360 [Deltaproteobacteria bacterium GWC2_55_46]
MPLPDIDGNNGFGVAIDLGTTTIAGALVDLGTGAVAGELSLPNPQSGWGRDVVSRIDAGTKDPATLAELKNAALAACNSLITRLASGRTDAIKKVTVAGNPAMEHLFLGISPEPLSRVPYRPAFKEPQQMPAREAGLEIDAALYVFPLIGGFVGGDAVAAALALGMGKAARPVLAIDIGTNSEILLAVQGSLFATSAAAGPAFEGGEVERGMTAGPGAIEGMTIEGDSLKLKVIGNVAPRGICGSGLIEAAHVLLEAGIMDRSGRIKDRDEVSTNLANRIKESGDGNSFVLFRGAKGEVSLSQQDIRALQTAKSATRAGINILLDKAGLNPEDIEKVYLAGAFGAKLSSVSLKGIGLLYEGWQNVEYVGDAALDGAVMALGEVGRNEAGELAGRAKYVPLSGSSRFEREFITNIGF